MRPTKLFHNPHVIWQTGGDEEIAEPAISVCTDNSGLIVLNQEGREVLVNKGTVRDLIDVLRRLSSV